MMERETRLYSPLHCSPACRRDTQRRAAGPNPSAFMHLSTQFLLSLSYALEKSRNTRHPDSCADSKKSTSFKGVPSGQAHCPLSSGPRGRQSGWYPRPWRKVHPTCLPRSLASALRRVMGRYKAGSERGPAPLYNRTMVPRSWVGVRDTAADSKRSVNTARRGGPSRGQSLVKLVGQAVIACRHCLVVCRGEAYREPVRAPAMWWERRTQW